MKTLGRCWIVVLLAILAVPTRAAPSRKVVMVIVPAVSLNDLASKDLPNLRELMDSGAVGLMNSRTAGRVQEEKPSESDDPRRAPESGYLTIGAGARAIAGSDAARAFNRNETVDGDPAWAVVKRLTLVDPKTSEVVHTRIARLIRNNSTLNHAVSVGMLGSAIHKAGLKTAGVGNSDDGAIHREAALICMDADGLVDFGDVGAGMTVRDPRSPSGIRTSEPGLLREAARCIRLADFTVIELGDTARLDRARLDSMDDIYAREKARVLRRTDALIGRLMRLVDRKTTTLIVLSPYPSSEALEKSVNSLCPVIMSGPGIARGFLISGSTRVRGLVTNTDIAPTILSALGVSIPKGLVGRTISYEPNIRRGGPIRALIGMNERVSRQAAAMPVLRQAMVGVIVLVGIITALWWILPVGRPTRRKLLPAMVLIPPAIAPAMMLLALRPVGSQMVTWVCLIASVAVIIALCSILGRKPLSALMLISLGASALFLGDLAAGNPLCRFSIMGYSIIEGARYYGMGNEFMGVLIGSSIVGVGLLLGSLEVGLRAVRIMLFLAMTVVTVAVGAPMLGANVGGAIAVVFGYCSAIAATSKKPFDPRRIMAVIGLLAAVIVIFAVLDSLRGQQLESHLGRAIRAAREGGFGGIGEIASRKLAMNWLLIRYALWSRLLAAYVLSAGFAFFARRTKPMPAHVRIALTGAIGGALAALVFNDSGIVAAATAFAYPWALILLAILDSEPHKGDQRNREPA